MSELNITTSNFKSEVLESDLSIVVLGTPKEWNVSRRNFTPTSFFSFLWAAAALW